MEVLNNIPVKLDFEIVSKKLRLRNKNEDVEKIIQELIETSRSVGKPKAVFEISRVENKRGDSVDIGGVRFTSHVLRVNLDKVERVFPYVVTCGRELDEIKIPPQQVMQYYFLDQIKEIVVRSALNYLNDYLRKHHAC